MCEILRDNFEQSFSAVENALRRSDFIAIDTEFTGLKASEQLKPSLFDSSEERYRKLRRTVSQISICQIGLSAFVKDPKENRYEAHSYNFYLYPSSFGPIDVPFLCQASSLEFLCKYDFDFNKFIYHGLSFMNNEQEEILRNHLSSRRMFTGLEREVDEEQVQRVCSRVAEWVVSSQDGDTFTIQKEDMLELKAYVLSTELRSRFPTIWTKQDQSGNTTITVEKIMPEKRQVLESQDTKERQQQESKLMQSMLGFTRVVRVLMELKKPLLGHNMFTDLLLVYEKFYKPLPVTYREFKSQMNALFPKIIDTKHITNTLRRPWEENGLLESTSLGNLYLMFNSPKGRDHVIHSPSIVHAADSINYAGQHVPHEAGYDAFMCGFVFLRLAHILTFQGIKSTDVVPCTFHRYMQSMSDYKNRINLIRATLNYTLLDGEDPVSKRPDILYVKSRKLGYSLHADQLARWFSPYGSVDIQQQSSTKALVATSNFRCARDILSSFRNHNLIYVTRYRVWKHSPIVRGLLWSGAVVSGGICMWLLMSSRKDP